MQKRNMVGRVAMSLTAAVLLTSVAAAILLVTAGFAHASEKALTIVVPFAAGGPADSVARAFAAAARKRLRQQVVVENVTGGGGTEGAYKVATAPADGSIVLLHNIGISAAPALYPDLPYATLGDFEYVGLFVEVPMALIGRKTLPASFAELRTWAAGRGGEVTLAHAGVGSASHLCGLLIQSALRLQMSQRSYPGNAPAMRDVEQGKVDLLCDVTSNANKPVADGLVRAYGVTATSSLAVHSFEFVPPLSDFGLSGTQITVWFGLSAPKNTPPATVQELNALVRAVAADPEFIRGQEAAGAVVVQDKRLTPAEHTRFVSSEIDHWREVLDAIGGHRSSTGVVRELSTTKGGTL